MSTSDGVKLSVPGPAAIGKAYRQSRRIKDVLSVLVRHGFGDLGDALRTERTIPAQPALSSETQTARSVTDDSVASRPERVRRVIEELGPTFVKLGQILSTRSDLLPAEYLTEFAKLQDRVPPEAFGEVRAVLEADMGRPLEDVFDDFQEEPLASASLGQVHRARLGGREVAVKVQRASVRTTIDSDIDLMMQLASLMERHVEGWDVHQPRRVVEEFAATIERELDYEVEAAHQERIARQFAADATTRVPVVYREATTSRVLTMDFIEGVKVSDTDALAEMGADRKELARRGFRLVLEQALINGFFHADPHPGNIFILPGDVVCFIDFGMMGRLSQRVRDEFVELIYHVVDRSPDRVARSVAKLAHHDGPVDMAALERDAAHFIDSYVGQPLGALNVGSVLGRILQALSRHGLRVPSDLFLMLKAMAEIESLAVSLDPEFDLVTEARPYVRRIFTDRFRPRRIAEDLAGTGREMAEVLRDAPETLRDLIEQAKGGGLTVHVDQERMPESFLVNDRIANRIAFSLVLAASLLGSAVVAAAGVPPIWKGISVPGLGGLLVSLVMAARLSLAILKRGKL